MKLRVLMHVQHLMGIGHQSRAALIARALDSAGAAVTYVSGGFPVPGLDVGGAEFVQLPPARAADSQYRGLVDEELRPVAEAWRHARRDQLLRVLDEHRPNVVVTETYPFGRRLLRFELSPLLDRLAVEHPATRLVSSVRDIVERRSKPEREREPSKWSALVSSGCWCIPIPGRCLSGRASPTPPIWKIALHTPGMWRRNRKGRRERMAGTRLSYLRAEAAWERHCSGPRSQRVDTRLTRGDSGESLVGPDLPEAGLRRLRAEAPPGLGVERNRRDFPHLLARCRASISQAGYNTATDIIRAGTRAVLVPYAESGEREQTLRAEMLEARGIAVMLHPDRLTPENLAAALDAAADLPRPYGQHVNLGGARRSAELLPRVGGRWEAMTEPGWQVLMEELAIWAEEERIATFWWRDDDASQPSAALERLLGLQSRYRVPLALAVIPKQLDAALALLVRAGEGVCVLQHGFAHRNHAGAGEKSMELSLHRPQEAGAGRASLRLHPACGELRGALSPGAGSSVEPNRDGVAARTSPAWPAGIVDLHASFKARARAGPAPGELPCGPHRLAGRARRPGSRHVGPRGGGAPARAPGRPGGRRGADRPAHPPPRSR